jgi:hypothetical protein
MKRAVIYHYFEKDDIYRDNLIFFLNIAVDKDVDYFIYISGTCSINLPNYPNIEYIYIENKNYDFGAVTSFSNHEKSNDYNSYIYINCSVRGPFVPKYTSVKWHEAFTSKLSKINGLVGSSINFLPVESKDSRYFSEKLNKPGPFTHVQTTSYALSSACFQLLKNKGFFNLEQKLSHLDIILRYEITLSKILTENGFHICSILPMNSFDANVNLNYPNTLRQGNPLRRSAFYGRTITPYENIFIKTNNDQITQRELASYTFTSLEKYFTKNSLDDDGITLFKKSSNEATKKFSLLERIIFKLSKKI